MAAMATTMTMTGAGGTAMMTGTVVAGFLAAELSLYHEAIELTWAEENPPLGAGCRGFYHKVETH
jgi:hypothetical protein